MGWATFTGTTEVGVQLNPFNIAIGDFNNDGNQDFVTADEGADTISIRLGDGTGNFSSMVDATTGVGDSPRAVAIGDFNNDGTQDLAIANGVGTKASIRMGGCFAGIISAVSRKMHNATPFDIFLPFGSQPGTECRTGGAGGNHSLVFTFTNNITSGGATVTAGTGTAGSILIAGNTMRVPLTGVTDQQQLTVTLNNVTDPSSRVRPPTPVNMTFLLGDTTGNKSVNASDITQTKSRSGIAIDLTNFRSDTNANGVINASDVTQVKLNSGHAVP